MQDWVFDIGAIAACCMAFVILLSIARIAVLLLKVAVLGGLLFFVGRNYLPEFSVEDIPTEKAFSVASEFGLTAMSFAEQFLRENASSSFFKNPSELNKQKKLSHPQSKSPAQVR